MTDRYQGDSFLFTCRNCNTLLAVGPQHRFYQFYRVRCSQCGVQVEHPLPKIRKKIIYLDQNVLSHILSERDARWQEINKRLRLLAYLQVVICPSSEIHWEESLLAEYSRTKLQYLYRELSEDTEFRSITDIQQVQLLRSIRRYLRKSDGSSVEKSDQDYSEFIEKDPNRWTLYDELMIACEENFNSLELLRERKRWVHADLVDVATKWMNAKDKCFKEICEQQSLALTQSMMKAYRSCTDATKEFESILPIEHVGSHRRNGVKPKFNPRIPPGLQAEVRIVHSLACEVHAARPEESDPVSVVDAFFQSEIARDTPFLSISSKLWAGIAQRATAEKPRSPEGNDKNDIAAISHYAPYCDAMFVDNFFRGLAVQSNIDVPTTYDVRIFSARTIKDFIAYLDELLTSIPVDHRKAVKAVVPNVAALSILKTN